ncbi:hypothetical protein [Acetobacter cibinongensis]|nr:hypothetical protein [Acetobacter cibinongensis]
MGFSEAELLDMTPRRIAFWAVALGKLAERRNEAIKQAQNG